MKNLSGNWPLNPKTKENYDHSRKVQIIPIERNTKAQLSVHEPEHVKGQIHSWSSRSVKTFWVKGLEEPSAEGHRSVLRVWHNNVTLWEDKRVFGWLTVQEGPVWWASHHLKTRTQNSYPPKGHTRSNHTSPSEIPTEHRSHPPDGVGAETYWALQLLTDGDVERWRHLHVGWTGTGSSVNKSSIRPVHWTGSVSVPRAYNVFRPLPVLVAEQTLIFIFLYIYIYLYFLLQKAERFISRLSSAFYNLT